MNPYKDTGTVRQFSHLVQHTELVWHRDHENRTVTVLEGSGWQFQVDNCLPVLLNTGDQFEIPGMVYHRILKTAHCAQDLLLDIKKHCK